ncbi:hypothetical protein [Streptomyces roseoviridis]|uniref:Uncharacterized protein n=1 Tax=Streptomyces roseoviridis TaxID=67361 RepID=A0ABV5R1A0_9ACTN
MTDQTAFDLDDVLPAWEANYEPGNVSDYLIGYANSEATAKGAAIAWVTSQTDKDPATLEWVEMPPGDRHDRWFNLIQNAEDGMALDLGVTVRRRLPATVRDAARQATAQPAAVECPQCDDTGACNGGPCAHPAAGRQDTQTTAAEAEARRRLAAVERLCSGRPGYHTITVKALLTAMSDAAGAES